MDRDNLWVRRSSTARQSSDSQKTETANPPRAWSTNKRFGDGAAPGRSRLSNGAPPIDTASTIASPGASSAFGLGSGAFASFGSANKTPKTPGAAFDFSKAAAGNSAAAAAAVAAPSPGAESDKQLRTRPTAASRTTSSAVPVASSGTDPKSWPLKHTWVMWYRPPTSKHSDYEKSIKPLYKMSTAQEFWKIYVHLKRPSALPTVSDYHFFKESIRPVWEDDENKKGGKWIMRLKKGVIDRYWDDMLLATVGDQFAEAGEEVCGMVVSVRSGEDVLSVWTKNNGGRNVKIRETIKRTLNLPADTQLVWKSHDDSIAQRSAIDQARQDKSTPDKRRNTLHDRDGQGKDKSAAS